MANDPPSPQPAPAGRAARLGLTALAVLVILGPAGFVGMTAPAAAGDGGTAQAMAATSQADAAADQALQRQLRAQRLKMVAEQIRARGVTSPRVLAAMEQVPRHLFVPEAERGQAYEDHPLPIGGGQ